MKRNIWIGIISIALIILIVIIYSNLERETLIEESRLKARVVRQNSYLAAEHFLEEMGKSVTYHRGRVVQFDQLPPIDQTVILIDSEYYEFEGEYIEELYDWIEEGGNLVMTFDHMWKQIASGSIEDPAYLIVPFRFELSINKKPLVAKEESDRPHFRFYQGNSANHPEDLTMHLDLPKAYHFDQYNDHFYEDYRCWEAAASNGSRGAVQIQYGAGSITLLSTSDIWKNERIDQYDHAWFLNYLTDQNVLIKIADDDDQKNLFQALLNHYPFTLIGLLMIVGAILWNQGMRSGPIERAVSRDRRYLSEYLSALASFTLKESGEYALLEALREDIHHQASQKSPSYSRASIEERYKILARLTDKPLKEVTALMEPIETSKHYRSPQFISTVISLQAMRNRL